MEQIKKDDLQSYVQKKVTLAILDKNGGDQAAFVTKKIQRLEYCPDNTHLRIYFDHRNFFAIPLTAKVSKSEFEWVANDQNSGLQYVIREESGLND